MRKWITLLMTFLVGASASYANASSGQVTLEAGYRRDNISWKTSFPSDSPFLKTETKFRDIDIFQIGLHGRTTLGYNLYLRANAYWGWVLDGDFRQSVNTYFTADSGYQDCGFGFEDGNHNVIDDKYVYGISAAIGYPFYFCDCSLILAPIIGYAFDEQNFSVEDAGFDLYESGCFFFPVSGAGCCEHKWINKWYGPFVGVDFNYRPFNECWNFYAELEYHWGSFKGKRHANRSFDHFGFNNDDFRSHRAHGWVFAAGADYDISDCWTVGLGVKFQDWSANRRHSENNNFSDYYGYGNDCCSSRERTRHKWHSAEVKLAIGTEFGAHSAPTCCSNEGPSFW